MASPSTSTPDHRGNTGNFQKSHFRQTVCLADWWLVKAENDVQGRRLAVAGLTDRGEQAVRVFTSAPILKRYDAFTIETTDGICVILKGFINKACTLEHGFPSDVFNHFVFGFPLYWKEYDEKFLGKEPPSKDIVTDKPLEQLSPKLGSMGGAQTHLDSHEKDFGSQGKIEAKGKRKSKQAKSLAVPLPQKYSLSGLQKELYCGGACVEDHTAPELPVNCLKNEIKPLSNLSCDGSIKVSAVIDKNTLFACHLHNKKTKRGADNSRKMDDKKTKTNSDWDMSSSEKISSHNEVRAMTCSIRNFRMKGINNQRSAGIAYCEKIRLNPISSIGSGKVELELVVDQEPVSRNNWNSEEKGIREIKTRSNTRKAKNKATDLRSTPAAPTKSHHNPAAVDNQRDTVITGKNSLLEKAKALDMVTRQTSVPVSKVGPSVTIIPETCKQDKGIREIKTRSNTRKAKNEATELPSPPVAPTKSRHTPAAVDNRRDTVTTGKNCLSEKAKALDMMTRQKSVPVSKKTPERQKEKGWSASPQSGTFNISRSGRLLMPTLEFWRNQRAIYSADRTITGIEEGMRP